jgi:hypothetical protein
MVIDFCISTTLPVAEDKEKREKDEKIMKAQKLLPLPYLHI